MSVNKQNLLIIGSLPPPIGGATILFDTIMKTEVVKQFNTKLLNFHYSNTVSSHGKLSIFKVFRLVKYTTTLISVLIFTRIDLVFSAIQFNRIAFTKDILLASICKAFGKKIVGCVVGIGLEELYLKSGIIRKYIIQCGVSLFDTFIVPSKELYLRYFPADLISCAKIRVVPFGIFTESDLAKTEAFGPSDHIQVLYYSHFIRSKGIDEVIEAIPIIIKKYSNISFVFAGAWDTESHKKEIFEIVKKYGLSSKMTFYGLITGNKKREILLKSDIYVLPTYFEFEGLPLSILEAMSYGCAIVATDHAAISSVVKDGINGAICRPRDPEDVANKIVTLIENRSLLLEIRQNNIKKYKECYTAELFGKRLAQTLGDISN